MWESEVDRLRKLQAARLKEARKLRGFRSARAAAQRFGWPAPTYGSHENGTRGIGRMYREYAKKLRVNPAWLLGHSDERDSIVRGVAVVADVAIGTWRERQPHHGPPRIARNVGIPSRQDSDETDKFAVRIADASMNKEFPQGAFAICVHCDEDTLLRVGQVVYIERVRDGLMELSLRRVTSANAGSCRLSTYSHDPKLRQDVAVPPTRADERIRVLGIVVGKYEDFSPV